jgi:hypothetical protein
MATAPRHYAAFRSILRSQSIVPHFGPVVNTFFAKKQPFGNLDDHCWRGDGPYKRQCLSAFRLRTLATALSLQFHEDY